MTHLSHSPFRFLSFFIYFLLASSDEENFYQTCEDNFSCGSITDIGYPFRSLTDPQICGYPGFALQCAGGGLTRIQIENQMYRVLDITPSTKTMWIAREDVLQGNCPAQVQTNLDFSIFEFAGDYTNLTFLYGCSSDFPGVNFGSCFVEYGVQGLGNCKGSITYPVIQSFMGNGGSLNASDMVQILKKGFEIKWKIDDKACSVCADSKGRCGYDVSDNRSVCFCPDLSYMTTTCAATDGGSSNSAPSSGKGRSSTSINIILPIVGAVLAGIGLGWVIFCCRQRRKRLAVQSHHFSSTDKELPTTLANKDYLAPPSIAFTKSIPSYPSTKFDSRTETSYFGARIFTYTELEEATEDFAQARELGDGGFGAVYYGVLSDGCVVAVKRLYENNYKRVEQFKNEVEILTRLRHPNLVMLYGCSSKRSRDLLLVYEYVPNGTVADHLHGNRAKSGLLSWPVRLNIAIETAEALAYLHASDIIHRDVKTNNILLDNDFHVKVADFGLSRLFPVDATHVSTAPQGTPGYVDPEYYQWYQLTEKSDVYSFGVVLVELISSLQAVDINRSRHDINLANMAINKVQNHAVHELVDQTLQIDSNSSVKKMVTLVAELAFRCLQQEKDMRPSMQEVLDTLRRIQSGGLNAQKVEVVDILVDDCGSCKDATLPPSPDSVTDKSTSTSAKSSRG